MQPLTFGVEEEFALVNSNTLELAPISSQFLADLPARLDDYKSYELSKAQVEMVTGICTDKRDLHNQLYRNRKDAAIVGQDHGVLLLASGVSPFDSGLSEITDIARYHKIREFYGALVQFPIVNGCHVHVGVHDKETAVKVTTALRPWLPTIQLLTNNSPIYNKRDTEYSSWRLILAGRFPAMGIAPYMTSVADYDNHVQYLIESESIPVPDMLFWWARPSRKFPTVEVRVGDIGLTPTDSTLYAVVIRALIAALVQDVESESEIKNYTDQELKFAHWRVSKDGIYGKMIDPDTNRLVYPFLMLNKLWNKINPFLEQFGDLNYVVEGFTRLYRQGAGADKQRKTFLESGPASLVEFIARETKGE